ncbi:hypothetical protein C2138_07190 [Salinibacterium hongtaonis]|nr:hypothetical protein C2138_07190 [Salinibacterium hongtaonis]
MPGSNVIPAGDFALPDPPRHRSLADHELVSVVQSSQGTSGALAELEMQLQLRIEEARDFEEWERAMLAIGSPGAFEAIQQARRVRAARLMPPQAPVEAPNPVVEPPQFPSAMDESDLDDEPSAELNLAPEWLPVSAASRGLASDSFPSPPFQQAEEAAPLAATAAGAAAAADMGPETQRTSIIERNDGEPTPQELRTSRAITMFWLWFAPHSSVIGVAVGASMLALGLSLRQSLVAVLVGVALSMIPLGLGTLAGRSTGQPAMVASRAVFGVVGNILPAVISVATRILWACALAVVSGGGVAAIVEQVAGFDAPWVGIVAAAATLAVGGLVAAVGYTVIVRVSVAVGVLSAVLVGALVAFTLPSLDVGQALSVPDGSWLVTLSAAVVVFSVVGLAWATSGADVARYQRAVGSGAPALAWAMAGCVIPAVIVIGYGAILAFSVPDASAALAANPAEGLAAVVPGMFLVPLLVLLVGGLVCGVTIALYSAGFGLTAAGLTVARPIAVVVASVLALAASLALSLGSQGFGIWFRDGVTTFAVPMAAWVGIVGADFLLRRRPLDGLSLMRRGGAYPHVVPLNLVTFIGVTALGWGFTTAELSGLAWQGYLWQVVGVSPASPAASTDVGVLMALVLGLLVALATGIPAIRRQESLRR